MFRAVLALSFTCAGAALAQDISLQTPIDCDLTQTCYIQQYVDRDPGPDAQDYTCAGLSYDNHKGTDFALPSTAMIDQGVNVLAAASGVVAGTRDGMPDTGGRLNDAGLQGRECGNGVRIEHDDGWTTQYCHLRQGSVSVRNRDVVDAGAVLGQVGQSGAAEFPHLHMSLRRNGDVVDPFDAYDSLDCGAAPDGGLWQDPPPYRPGGLVAVGFLDRIPDYTEVKSGTAHDPQLTTQAEALVIWGFTFGTRADDLVRLTITGPQGVVISKNIEMERPQALAFRAIGKKRRNDPWPAGSYAGSATLIRDGQIVEQREIGITLR